MIDADAIFTQIAAVGTGPNHDRVVIVALDANGCMWAGLPGEGAWRQIGAHRIPYSAQVKP